MKRVNQGTVWAIFLLLIGLFLLLKNLGVFGAWGEVAWGGLFAIFGLGFLIWFLTNPRQWWRAIPGFVLLSIGAPSLLEWQKIHLGPWNASVVLFGIALAFWTVLLVKRENWWAEIPAGVLTVIGLLIGLQDTLRPASTEWVAALLLGLGLVFALLYLLRLSEQEMWWPAAPAAALILAGIVTWIGPLGPNQVWERWWPVAMMVLGVVVLVLSVQRLPMQTTAGGVQSQGKNGGALPKRSDLAPDFDATPPAENASVTQVVPEAELPPARPRVDEPAQQPVEPPADSAREMSSDELYDFLKQQQEPSKPEDGPSQ